MTVVLKSKYKLTSISPREFLELQLSSAVVRDLPLGLLAQRKVAHSHGARWYCTDTHSVWIPNDIQ